MIFFRSLALFALVIATSAQAARVAPPLSELRKPPAIAVIAEIVSINASAIPPTIEFRTERTLYGAERAQMTLYVEPALLPRIATGRALMVYAGQTLDRAKEGRVIDRPIGTLLMADGAAPALFRNVDAIEPLLSAAHAALPRDAAYARRALAGVTAGDPQLRDLWSAELVLTPKLLGFLKPSEQAQLLTVIDDATAFSTTRARLLEVFNAGYARAKPTALAPLVNRALAALPLQITTDHDQPEQLAWAALAFANAHPKRIDRAALERWLRSPRPSLAEQAALALRALDPPSERAAIDRALSETLLPAATRGFLLDHLRRLELARSAAR